MNCCDMIWLTMIDSIILAQLSFPMALKVYKIPHV